jgi:CoA:oxalate CoA-transferase
MTPSSNAQPLSAVAPKPLDGLRVLDFTRVLSGPYCTALLADLGADVLKIEPPQGDDYRHIGPFYKDGSSALFENVNRGKRSVVLDLSEPAHRDLALELATGADVLVENFRPGVADKLGIGWETVKARNSRIIYASISGFGQDGPNARRPAYDIVLQALSGIMTVTGEPEGTPTLIGESIADVTTGLFGSWAIMAALYERERRGEGRRIDVSMFESMIALQPIVVTRCLATGEAPRRVGNRHPLSAPFGAFRAADKLFVLAALNPKLFETLANLIERPDLIGDPRFVTDSDRLENEPELRAAIEKWSTGRSAADAVSALVKAGVPAAEVSDMAEALQSEQARARPVLQNVRHGVLGEMAVPEQPVRFSGVPRGGLEAAAPLGAHTEQAAFNPNTIWKAKRR